MQPKSPPILRVRAVLAISISFSILSTLLLVLPQWAQEPTFDELVERARELAAGSEGERSLPLYERAVERLADQDRDLERAGLLGEMGLVSFRRDRLDSADTYYRRAIEIYESPATETDDATRAALATTLNNLAALQIRRGASEEAEALYRRVIELRRSVFGQNHAAVAFSLNELATLYHGLGRLDEASELYGQSLAIEESLLGPDHPQLIPRLTNLAVVHRVRGQTELAGPLLRRALAITETTHGGDHPEVAAALNNLAVLESDLEHWDEAESLYRRALEIQQRVFGQEHFSVAMSLRNLASLYLRQGREDEAISATRRMDGVLDANCDLERGLVRTPEQRTACRDARLMHRHLARQLRLGDEPLPSAPPPSPAPTAPTASSVSSAALPTASPTASPAATNSPEPRAGTPRTVYRAQVKAFQERQLAEEDAPRLRARHDGVLGGLPHHVVRADLGAKGLWFRIQFGDFASQGEAQSLCRALAESGHEGCWVVKTQLADP